MTTTFHSFIKGRLEDAKKFTEKNFIDDSKRSIKDYEIITPDLSEMITSSYDNFNKRYEFTIPLIFTQTESMKASLFDRPPGVTIKERGEDDSEKAEKVKAAYEYLVDKLDLESFMHQSAHWFSLLGFCTAHAYFKSEVKELPQVDEATGEPKVDPETGETITVPVYTYNDPVIEVGDPCKEYYSPESRFSISGDKVPYYIKEEKLTTDEIRRVYGKTVEPDTTIDKGMDGVDAPSKADCRRVTVYFYYGQIPDEYKTAVKQWTPEDQYLVVFTQKEILAKEKLTNKMCRLGKWYGSPTSFFGFGIGKIGRQFQIEKSIRRGQQIRLADVAAFPKIAIKNDGEAPVDTRAMQDPRANAVLLYQSEPPQYLQPGNLADVVTASEQAADRDAQQAFGMLDLSQGAQTSTTVKTATGQSIFAESADKRVRLAKQYFTKFYREVVIMLLKLCQENWDEEKLIKITDEEGEEKEVSVTKEDLQGIDFDTDLRIDTESTTNNKDIIREQSIALYDKVKDDPLIDRTKVFKDMVRVSFGVADPDRYIKKSEVEPGTVVTDQQGNQYTVDESGQLVSQQTQSEMPTGEGEQESEDVASSPSGLMGSVQ